MWGNFVPADETPPLNKWDLTVTGMKRFPYKQRMENTMVCIGRWDLTSQHEHWKMWRFCPYKQRMENTIVCIGRWDLTSQHEHWKMWRFCLYKQRMENTIVCIGRWDLTNAGRFDDFVYINRGCKYKRLYWKMRSHLSARTLEDVKILSI